MLQNTKIEKDGCYNCIIIFSHLVWNNILTFMITKARHNIILGNGLGTWELPGSN